VYRTYQKSGIVIFHELIKILPQRRKGNAKFIKALRPLKDLSAFAVNKKASLLRSFN
jgi:hypothetical protein